MPRVPLYGEPKAETRPLPGVRIATDAPISVFGGGPILAQASNTAIAIMQDEKDKADEQAVYEARRKLNDWERTAIYDPQNGALAQKGKNAFDLPERMAKDYDKAASGIESGLGNEVQKSAFRRIRDARRGQVMDWTERHVAGERERYYEESYQADMESSKQRIALHPDKPEVQAAEFEIMRQRIAGRAMERGMPAEQVPLEIQKQEADAHGRVITALITANADTAAKAYYDKVQDKLDEKQRARFKAAVTAAVADGEGMRGAETIWRELGPATDADPVNIDRMADAARERYKDPDIAKAVVAGLKERAYEHNAAQKERTEANQAAIWEAVDRGAGLGAVRAMPQFKALSGADRLKVSEHIVDRAYALQARARAERSEARAEQEERFAEAYWRYAEPEQVARMTRNEIWALYPSLGPRYTQDLLRKNHEYTKPERLAEATVDADLFKAVTQEAGFKATSSKDKERLVTLKNRVEQEIGRTQEAKKRTLTREEKEAITRGLMVDVQVREPGMLWGENVKKRKLFEVTAPESIVVPDQERADIIRDFNARAIRYTEGDVLQAYLRKRVK